MKRVYAAAIVIAAFLSCGSARAEEWSWTADGFVSAGTPAVPYVPIKPAARPVTIPPGFHAHTRTDGTVIVHSDSNLGKVGPHEGVAYPWPKTGRPGQTVIVDEAPFVPETLLALAPRASCPTGVPSASCPQVSGITFPQGSFYAETSVSTEVYGTAGARSGPVRGLFARIAANAADRRAGRQANRSGRRAGGCP